MALIIVEGPDAVGKTTLINQLASELNLPIVKSYKPTSRSDIYAFSNWANACPRTPICDRHAAISDLVYGPIIRGATPSSLSLAQATIRNNYLIHVNPGKDIALKHLQDQKQMDGVIETYSQLYDGYEKLMEQLTPDFIYNWTNPRAFNVLVNNLVHFLERSK